MGSRLEVRADRRGLGGLGLEPPAHTAMSHTAKSHRHRGRAYRRGGRQLHAAWIW